MRSLSAARAAGLFTAPLFASVSLPAPASAASATARASAQIVRPLEVARLSDLSFGSLSGGSEGGRVRVTTSGGRMASGGARVIGTGSHHPAQFKIMGEPGAGYIVGLPAQVNALGPGGMSLTVVGLEAFSANRSQPGPVGQLDASGADRILVGGEVIVPAGAPEGSYAADFEITVNYQ